MTGGSEEEERARLVVLGEASLLITSSIRKSDDVVLKSLVKLKNKLRNGSKTAYCVTSDPSFLIPFCEIVKDKEIGGRLTGLALQSIHKFIAYGLVEKTESKGSAILIGESVTKARFVASDTESDEVVLMRIVNVLRELIVREFRSLTNEIVNEIMKSTFRIAFETRLKDLLRKTAEQALVDMVRSLFRRIGSFTDHQPLQETSNSCSNYGSIESIASQESVGQQQQHQVPEAPAPTVRLGPHGMECVAELFAYMTSLINQFEDQNTEPMITAGLTLLIVAFESAVNEIGRKSCLMSIVKNELSFNIIQLLQSTRPLTSIDLTLRLSFIVFSYLRHSLKYQMESLLTRLKDIVTTQNAPIEFRELALEYLVAFFKHIKFLSHEIFFNYDLDPYASNLMEELFEFFSKNCFSSSSPEVTSSSNKSPSLSFTSIQLLSLDALLENLNSLHRAEVYREVALEEPFHPDELSSPEDLVNNQSNVSPVHTKVRTFPTSLTELVNMKQRKCLLENATNEFNSKPKDGVASLRKNGLVSSDEEIAKFFRENQNLSKRMLGEFLSKKDNTSILTAFIDSFDLNGLRLDEALRVYLETFRLPGEAPLVHHLLEPFATAWHVANSCPFENHDAAFTLSYAIIMLNVDQHNINVKKQNPVRTCDQFIKNVSGVNGGKNFDAAMLKEIYNAIRSREIVMPAEHEGPVRDKYLWKCLLRRDESEYGIYAYVENSTNLNEVSIPIEHHRLPLHLLNSQIFSKAWGPTVSAMTFMYDRININHNSTLTQRILSNGFNSCALLCSTYGNLDKIIVMLCKFTVPSTSCASCPLPSHKTQLAAQTLFGIVREYANEMRDSWINIVQIILYWFKLSFLDDELQVDDFALNKKVKIRRKIRKENNKGAEQSASILSTFYSLFAGSNPEIYEDVKAAAAESDAVSTDQSPDSKSLSAGSSLSDAAAAPVPNVPEVVDENKSDHIIVTSCQPLSIIEDSKFLHIESLMELIKALINVNLELSEGEDGDDIEAFKLEILVQITLNNRFVILCLG